MARRTVLLVMAAVALLLVVLRLYRVDADEIAAVTLWMRITAEVTFFKIGTVQQSPLVAIKAPGLVMALVTVIAGLGGQHAMPTHKIGIMIW